MSNRTSTHSSRAGSPVDGGIRKRVGKACDRCRMKKARCDGSTPCAKCKADNSICVYGRRKRSSQDKVYPKGYVEMLEHQQGQLVLGLQELYRRLQDGESRNGEQLPGTSHEMPATHDLLEWLGALRHDDPDLSNKFYDDLYMMQAVAMLENSGSTTKDPSFSSRQSETDPSIPLEAEISDMTLDSTTPKASYMSEALFVDSPQLFTEEVTIQSTDLTTEAMPYFTHTSWQLGNTNIPSADFEVSDDWIYDINVQAVNNTAPSDLQQPANTSINPSLTLRDWSELYSYNFDKGFLHT